MEIDVRRIERVFGLKARNWKKVLRMKLARGEVPARGETSLALVGYPELFRVSLYLTEEGARKWSGGEGLEWPPLCCVCGTAPTVWLPPDISRAERIPHCEEHGQRKVAALIIDEGQWNQRLTWVALTGRNERFLLAPQEANPKGDVWPPWSVFPEYDSYSGFWRQGGEFWMAEVFWPFWIALDAAARDRYLEKWRAPPDWRERLLNNQFIKAGER